MKLLTINSNPTVQNTYLYFDEETKEGVIIDPGLNTNEAAEAIQKNSIQVKGILLTHGHYDHITAAADAKALTQAGIFCHTQERPMLEDPNLNLSVRTDINISIVPDGLFEDSDVFAIADTALEVIHTPGHTHGCVCYYDKKNAIIFTGDTLFKESVGRTDLPGGAFDDLVKSVRERLFTLPRNTKVYPGHGGSTSIGHEMESNPFIR